MIRNMDFRWLFVIGLSAMFGAGGSAVAQVGEIPSTPKPQRTSIAPAEKMMTVTLECEDGWEMAVMPPLSPGVDIVNLGGMAMGEEKHISRITFACLPDAVAYVQLQRKDANGKNETKEPPAPFFLLPLRPGDDKRVMKLRAVGPSVYDNNKTVWMDLDEVYAAMDNPNWSDQDRKELRQRTERLMAVGRAKSAWHHFGISVNVRENSVPILRALRGTGAGVCVATGKKPAPAATRKEFLAALAEVKPRLLAIDSRLLAEMKDDLPSIETLYLEVNASGALPDLSRLRSMKHLVIVVDEGDSRVDFKPIGKLTQLRALGTFGTKGRHIDRIGQLHKLRYLSLFGENRLSRRDVESLSGLRRLQYLMAEFRSDADLSFIQRMPHLRTLCIPIDEEQNLKPLMEARSLRCLAVFEDKAGFEKTVKFDNVKEFRQARPDVKVVPYMGICLGSFWLLPLAIGSGLVAWRIRRRRRTAY